MVWLLFGWLMVVLGGLVVISVKVCGWLVGVSNWACGLLMVVSEWICRRLVGVSEWVCVWLLSDIESIRRHLLGETEVGSSENGSIFDWSSSFSNLYPYLIENWDKLPLKEDDSEDMVLYCVLRDAVNLGWVPFPSFSLIL